MGCSYNFYPHTVKKRVKGYIPDSDSNSNRMYANNPNLQDLVNRIRTWECQPKKLVPSSSFEFIVSLVIIPHPDVSIRERVLAVTD